MTLPNGLENLKNEITFEQRFLTLASKACLGAAEWVEKNQLSLHSLSL
jgi:hypothetical protein